MTDEQKPADVASIVPDPGQAETVTDGPPTPQGAYGVPQHGDLIEEHPEILAVAGLAAGFLLAKVLGKLGGGGDG